MEQSVELMRKRHAYYTKLIAEHNIHRAHEFCDKLGEMFAMFGVEVSLNEDGISRININCEDYDYEYYTVVDGKNGGFATISSIVEWKHPSYGCHEEVDIFNNALKKSGDWKEITK